MKKLLVLLLTVGVAASLSAGGDKEETSEGMREYDMFIGYEKEDYPNEGTIFGDWLEEQTNVRINWEFVVGDLEQKVGLIAASGDYPDAVHPRNETNVMMNANAFIPLNDLVEEYGSNIQELYGDQIEMIKQDDGNMYWFPQQMPYGDKYQNPRPGHGLYIQKAVLEYFDYPTPANLEEALDMVVEYAEEHPTINGNETEAFTALTAGWREYALMNAPHIFSGHPNDGAVNVDWEDGRWVASSFYANQDAYDVYKLYNDVHLEGFYDTESFVMDYDQYIAKLSGGSVLAFYDQEWNFQTVQRLLLDQGNGRWYVPLPVVMEGYEPDILNPPQPQVSEGIGITVDADDPEGLMRYFNFLADWDVMKRRYWGREGTDYHVDDDGYFYRTDEQIAQWQNTDWRQQTYGAYYWDTFLRVDASSFYPDGKNVIDPERQPSVYQQSLTDAELEVLDAYDVETFSQMFPEPDMSRTTYFPSWTISLPTGSDLAITNERILEVRRRWTPRLVMAEEGQYDQVWENYLDALDEIPQEDQDALVQFYQDEIDKRVEAAGGY